MVIAKKLARPATRRKAAGGRVEVTKKRPSRGRPPRPGAPASVPDDSLSPGLYGIGACRYPEDMAEASVEDPLGDWPEGAAAEDDEWINDRSGGSIQKPGEQR